MKLLREPATDRAHIVWDAQILRVPAWALPCDVSSCSVALGLSCMSAAIQSPRRAPLLPGLILSSLRTVAGVKLIRRADVAAAPKKTQLPLLGVKQLKHPDSCMQALY